MRPSVLAAVSAIACLSVFSPSASAAELEASFVPPPDLGTYDSDPSAAVPVAGGAVFGAYDDVSGYELRFTDGTTGGTRLVRDLTPGPDGTEIREIVSMGDHALLFAAEPDAGLELWRTDGTAAGTTLVKDIVPGPEWSSPSRLTRAGSMAYFVAWTEATGYELWRSDGTEAGTTLVADLNPGPDSAAFQRASFVPMGDAVVLGAGASSDFLAPHALYRADASGLTPLPVPVPAGVDTARVSGLGTFGGDLIVGTAGTDSATTVWRTDGTSGGTRQLGAMDAPWQQPPGVTTAGGRLYLNLGNAGLWAGDGTPAGMARLGAGFPDDEATPVTIGGTVYFTAGEAPLQKYGSNPTRLWRTDGTSAGTQPVAAWGPASGRLGQPTALNGRLLLAGGTWTPGDVAPQFLGFAPSAPLAAIGDRAIAPGEGPGNAGREPWITDGTPAGTRVIDVNAKRRTARLQGIAALGDDLIVPAGSGDQTTESELQRGLYRVDPAGRMQLLSGVWGNAFASAPLDGAVLFRGRTDENGVELWRTDGTPGGTALVRDIVPGEAGSTPGQLTVAAGRAWFTAWTPETGDALWSSDGTAAGTVLVAEIVPGPDDAWAESIHAFGAGIVFMINRGNGYELWRSDGTEAGTARVGEMTLAYSDPIAVIGSTAYALGEDGRVWATDGTDAGTEVLAELPGIGYGGPILVTAGGRLFAGAADGVWAVDPASGAAELVVDAPDHQNLTVQGDHVLVSRGAADGGQDVWVSDGTVAGTRALLEQPPGDALRYVNWMQPAAGGTWIATYTDGQGPGLWHTDGTVAGTVAVSGPVPRPDRDPYPTALGADLVYVGSDALTEPWLVRAGERRVVTPPVDPTDPPPGTPTSPSTSPSRSTAPSETPAPGSGATAEPAIEAPAATAAPVRPRGVVTPRGLRVRVGGAGPGEWTVRGTLLLPVGTTASPATCRGPVTVTVRRAGREVAARTLRLDGRCAFTGAVRANPRGGKLTFRARFAGNTAVAAVESRTLRRPRAR